MNSAIAWLLIVWTASTASIGQCEGWDIQFPNNVDENLHRKNVEFDRDEKVEFNLKQIQSLGDRIGGEVKLDSIDTFGRENVMKNIELAGNPNARGGIPQTSSSTSKKTQTLIVALDGFRYDYPKIYPTPNLNKLASLGMFAPQGLKPIFATKTFPNFISIATGTYQETHGIVDNRFYDPTTNTTFSYADKDIRSQSHWYEKSEPIWITAKKGGKKVGVYDWVGSEVTIHGMKPDFWRRYDRSVPFKTKIETAINWLAVEKVDLSMVYFQEPDWTAHNYGPFSPETREKIIQVDQMIGHLMSQLSARQMLSTTNIIILADHGMASPAERQNRIAISDYIHVKRNIKSALVTGAVIHIEPLPGKIDYVYHKLKNANPHMKLYKKEDLPERWHYKASDRVASLVGIADEGYVISLFPKDEEFYIGQHGYDNELDSMKPMFYASGPSFNPKVKRVDSMETINLYNLMCRLIKVEPAANNGTMQLIEPLLKPILV